MMLIEEAIVETLQQSGPRCLGDIAADLPNFSWGRGIPRRGSDVARRTGVASPTRLLNLSDHSPRTVCAEAPSRVTSRPVPAPSMVRSPRLGC